MRRSIYRRPAVNPQAFAVKVNGAWAGSAGCPAQMNREMFWGIRSEMPAFINRLFPFFLIEISHDMHVSGVIHEIFHAFQAIRNETKFFHAERSHAGLKTYPGDPLFMEYWDKEGILLLRALNAKDRQELLSAVKAFLLTRKERRIRCNLPEDLISMEKDLEWLEGLAKYAEIRSYIVAADQEDRPFHFKKKNPYWQLEQKQRLRSLGASDGDNRFYHSGAAQAFILDKIHPGWKEEIMNDSIYLEDLLVQHTKSQTTAL